MPKLMLCVLQAGELMVVDPNLEEEAAASGLMTVIMNAFGELCAVQKTSGIGLPAAEVQSSACRLTLLTARLNFGSRQVPIAGCCPRQRFPKSPNRTFAVSELLAYVTVLLCKPKLRYRGLVHFGVHGLPS